VGWVQFAAALTAGLALRVGFVHFFGQTEGDSLLYGDIAKNLLQHGVYGMTHSDGMAPTLLRLPGYPLFLALCFKLFGMEHYGAVMLVQSVVDTGTALPGGCGDAKPACGRCGWARSAPSPPTMPPPR